MVDWIRNWIMQIAGITVLGSLCDMVMPQGEMRKYVKMVIGLILVFAVLRPIVSIPAEKINIDVPKNQQFEAMELKEKLNKTEQKKIIAIYCRKIEGKILSEIQKEYDCEVFIDVKVEEKEKMTFGNITQVEIVCEEKRERVDAKKLKKVISQKFGVDEESVEIRVN